MKIKLFLISFSVMILFFNLSAEESDTLEIQGRLLEIPGIMPPNDLYNYVYILKYRITKIVKGTFHEKEIYVGHYNPLIPRKNITGKMAKFVSGDIKKFEAGAKHTLTLIRPIDKAWEGPIEDEYYEEGYYFAIVADMRK